MKLEDIDELTVPETFRAKTWSLSALQNYEGCAFKYAIGRTMAIEEAPSYALQNGLEVHTLLENFLKDIIQGVPPRLVKLSKLVNNLKRHKAEAEKEVVLDRHWKTVEHENPWTAPNAWVRGKIDASVKLDDETLLIVDLKTGKSYPYYQQQAELYATLMMEIDPAIQNVEVEFWYSKTGNVEQYAFDRFDQAERQSAWDDRANKLMLEKHWMPRPGDGCKWCQLKPKCPAWV